MNVTGLNQGSALLRGLFADYLSGGGTLRNTFPAPLAKTRLLRKLGAFGSIVRCDYRVVTRQTLGQNQPYCSGGG